MRKVLISIQPKWCELIAEGNKIIEVRRTRPKIETPFKCYIYCTKEMLKRIPSYLHINEKNRWGRFGKFATWGDIGDIRVGCDIDDEYMSYGMHGKVIGEFTCNNIDTYDLRLKRWEYSDSVRDVESLEPVKILQPSYKITQEELDKMCIPWYEFSNYCVGKILYGWQISDLMIYDIPKYLADFGIEKAPQSWQYIDV